MEVEELVIQAMSVRQLKLLVAEANLAHLLPNAVEREDLRTLALQVWLWESWSRAVQRAVGADHFH